MPSEANKKNKKQTFLLGLHPATALARLAPFATLSGCLRLSFLLSPFSWPGQERLKKVRKCAIRRSNTNDQTLSGPASGL
jgi:hypothetical protein